MKQKHKGRWAKNTDRNETSSHKGRAGGRMRHGRGGRKRLFDSGELRILLLALIQQQPRHGYELIKAIGAQFDGEYEPSAGVIYPTLSWLDDIGYASVGADNGTRKKYTITPEGDAFLVANAKSVKELLARKMPKTSDAPVEVIRAMRDLSETLRNKNRSEVFDAETTEKIVTVLKKTTEEIDAI